MPFKKGVKHAHKSPGRPKNPETLACILRAELEELVQLPNSGERIAKKTALARVLISRALAGEIPAIKLVYDRVDGLAKQQVEVSGSLASSAQFIAPEMYPSAEEWEKQQAAVAAAEATANAERDEE